MKRVVVMLADGFEEIEALARETFKDKLLGKEVIKVVVIPSRLINFVVKG